MRSCFSSFENFFLIAPNSCTPIRNRMASISGFLPHLSTSLASSSHQRVCRSSLIFSILYFFRYDRSPIGKDLRHAVHHFVGVVAHIDDRIGAPLRCMLDHQLERLLPCLLTKFHVDG